MFESNLGGKTPDSNQDSNVSLCDTPKFGLLVAIPLPGSASTFPSFEDAHCALIDIGIGYL